MLGSQNSNGDHGFEALGVVGRWHVALITVLGDCTVSQFQILKMI